MSKAAFRYVIATRNYAARGQVHTSHNSQLNNTYRIRVNDPKRQTCFLRHLLGEYFAKLGGMASNDQ